MVKQPTSTQSPHKETKSRFASYESPLQLSIPNDVEEAFENMGYVLKWSRHIDPKTNGVDLKQLAKRARQGYEQVTHAELKNLNLPGVSEMFGRGNDPRTKDAVVMGDAILLKAPIEVVEERKQWIENESWRQINDLRRSFGEKIGGKINSTFKQKSVSFAKEQTLEIDD